MLEDIKFGIRLIATHLVMVILTLVLIPIVFTLFKSSNAQFIGLLIFTIIYVLAMWSDVVRQASKDARGREPEDKPYIKSIIASAVVTVPALVFFLFMIFGFPSIQLNPNGASVPDIATGQIADSNLNIGNVIFRLWMSPFLSLYTRFENNFSVVSVVTVIIIPLLINIAYIYGYNRQKSKK